VGAYSAPSPLAMFKGLTSKEREGKRKGGERREDRKGKEGEEEDSGRKGGRMEGPVKSVKPMAHKVGCDRFVDYSRTTTSFSVVIK